MSTTDQITPGRSIRVPAAESRRTAAYWYAAGMADGTGQPDRSVAFSRYHAKQARDYSTDQRTFLPSIPDAWSDFLAGIHPDAQPI